ncbi:MAG: SGNH/GDSL hydrolase family protein [Muribaculaceae bacterium]|nr:SGNH/GDSL hydrolase family protein [Muribaculaceae bacterium]
MTGDSHVFAKVYPNKMEEILREKYPQMEFGWWAKNGICFYSFNSTPEYYDSIFAFRPEILIVHLGTNGAYANNFSRHAFRAEMEKFYSTLTEELPDVKVVFVTPFTNKKRKKRKKGRWHVNYKNRDVADEIIAFVADHPATFVVDNNKEVGMGFLKNRELIRPDNVHLTEKGYERLATMVAPQILEFKGLWPVENEQTEEQK